MIRGSCLCGNVRCEFMSGAGPFELCHCSRCRKASGSAFVAGLMAARADFRLLSGLDGIAQFEAPVRESPPGYRSCFCRHCGSPLPDVFSGSPVIEIPAGLLDDDPGVRPERHIYVDFKSPWFDIGDGLPRLDRAAVVRLRQAPKHPA
ncbi:MAG: GFA family protein [Gammaproteobacteria bacterium]